MQGHKSFFSSLSKDVELQQKQQPKREIKISQPVAPKDSYYTTLGIPVDASHKEIQDAYMGKWLAASKADEDSKLQSLLQTAYQALTDNANRKKYDTSIKLVRPIPWSGIAAGETTSIFYNKNGFHTSIVIDLKRYQLLNQSISLDMEGHEKYIENLKKLNSESKNPLIKAISNKAPLNEIKEILKTLSSDSKNERDKSEYENTPAHLAILIDRDDDGDAKEEGELLTILKNAGCDLSLTNKIGQTLSHQAVRVLKLSVFDVLDKLGVAADDWESLNLKQLGDCGKSVSNLPSAPAVIEMSKEEYLAKAPGGPK